jgi:hypothetical protein
MVSVLPASVPSARRTPPMHLWTTWRPSMYSPSGMPAAAVESVTQNSLRDRAQRDLDRARMHVQQVGDDLGVLRMRQRGADHAGFAVVQAGHRVEQVGEAGRAVFQRLDAVLVGAGGMADLHADAGIGHLPHQGQVAVDLGRHVIRRIGAWASKRFDFVQLASRANGGWAPSLPALM